jgi:uncharacterized protein (DUF1499 family)
MRILKWLLLTVAVLAGLGLAAGRLGLLRGSAPRDLGVKAGKLKAPSMSPNSVSSQADLWPGHPQQAHARIAPLAVAGDPAAAMARVKAVVQATPGAVVVQAEGDYLYAQFTTPLMQFTDDVEFWYDRAAGVVQVRSASRLGESDLGANRKRIEALRERLAAN